MINRNYLIVFFIMILPLKLAADWKKLDNLPPGYQNNYWLEIWSLPEDPDYMWICGFQGKVIRTTDRGETWAGSTIRGLDQMESIHFTSKDIGYVSGNVGNQFGGLYYILKSTDGGATWNDISPVPNHSTAIWGHYFINDNVGVVVGGDCINNVQYFFRTTNGGSSWSVTTYNISGTKMSDVKMFEENGLGYAISSGHLWITNDGGRRWSVISNTGSKDWHEDFHIVDNTIIVPFSGGCNGINEDYSGIRSTTDFGDTWREWQTDSPMYGSFVIDSVNGWACGTNNNVWQTTDGGVTWMLRNCGIEPGTINLDDMFFLDDSTGWVVGEGVYKRHFYDKLYPEIVVEGPRGFCEDADTRIYLEEADKYSNILWSDGSTGDTIEVDEFGKYWVKVWDVECNQGYSDTIEIIQFPKPEIEILSDGPVNLCEGETALIEARSGADDFLWSNGESGNVIEVDSGGIYTVTVTDSNGCTNTAEVEVIERPNPKPGITQVGDTIICTVDSLYLLAGQGFVSYQWYEMNDPEKLLSSDIRLDISESGTYYVRVINEFGCKGVSELVDLNLVPDSNRLELLLDVDRGYIDYDSVALTKQRCVPARITNTSENDYILEDAYVYMNVVFSIPQTQFPYVIPAGETVSLEICFTPFNLGLETDTVLIGDVCSPHRIALIAQGVPFNYDGITRCDIPVKVSINEITSFNNIRVNPPYPNPADNSFSIQFARFIPDGASSAFKVELFSAYGEKAGSGRKVINKITHTDDGRIESGELIFDTSRLTAGSYLVRLTNGKEILSIPVVVL